MEDVTDYLRDNGLQEHIPKFIENAVDGDDFLCLTDYDLKVELEMEKVLHRKKILKFIQKQKAELFLSSPPTTTSSLSPSFSSSSPTSCSQASLLSPSAPVLSPFSSSSSPISIPCSQEKKCSTHELLKFEDKSKPIVHTKIPPETELISLSQTSNTQYGDTRDA